MPGNNSRRERKSRVREKLAVKHVCAIRKRVKGDLRIGQRPYCRRIRHPKARILFSLGKKGTIEPTRGRTYRPEPLYHGRIKRAKGRSTLEQAYPLDIRRSIGHSAFNTQLGFTCVVKEVLMNTGFRSSLSVRLFFVILVVALLCGSIASQAQSTLFGSGGSSNNIIYAPNLAFGYSALASNTTGTYNTAMGNYALTANTTGGSNTAFGSYSLYQNTSGGGNTANGFQALYSNTTGLENTAIGNNTL